MSFPITWSSIEICPESDFKKPQIVLKKTDLPDPFIPIKP